MLLMTETNKQRSSGHCQWMYESLGYSPDIIKSKWMSERSYESAFENCCHGFLCIRWWPFSGNMKFQNSLISCLCLFLALYWLCILMTGTQWFKKHGQKSCFSTCSNSFLRSSFEGCLANHASSKQAATSGAFLSRSHCGNKRKRKQNYKHQSHVAFENTIFFYWSSEEHLF